MSLIYNKFQCFATDLLNKVHDLIGTAGSGADTLKVYLTNATPNLATNTVKGDLADITNQNGYTGPTSVQNVSGAASGTVTITGTTITFTASGGSFGPFRYIVLYNSTPGSVPLVAEWDYASALTLNDGESLTLQFNSGVSTGTVFTLG